MKLFLLKDGSYKLEYAADPFFVILNKRIAYLETDCIVKSIPLSVQFKFCLLKMNVIYKRLPYLLTLLKSQKP
jgi:hypothetical protein